MIIYEGTLKLVSINQKYIWSKRHNRLILSKTFRNFSQLLYHLFRLNRKPLLIEPKEDIGIKIDMKTYIDVDNPIKCIIDSLAKVYGFNDRHVVFLQARKKHGKKGEDSFLRVELLRKGEQ